MNFTLRIKTNRSFRLTDELNFSVLDEYGCPPFSGDSTFVNGLKMFSYSVTMLSALIGNALLIVIICRNKRMQTLTNCLIANMAVSDILITVLAVSRHLSEIVLGPRRWLVDGFVGSVLCKCVFFFQDISTGVSILSLTVITIDRYSGLVFPFRGPQLLKRKRYKVVIPLLWIIPMVIHCPYFYIFRITSFHNKTYCTSGWAPKFDGKKTQEIYYITVFCLLIVLPTCIITVLNSVIIANVRRGLTECKVSVNTYKSRRLQENARVVRYILAILTAFVFCVTPINVYAFLFYFAWKWKMPCGMENFAFAAHFILYLNASMNPFIYFTLNDKYRRGLTNIANVIFHGCKKTS